MAIRKKSSEGGFTFLELVMVTGAAMLAVWAFVAAFGPVTKGLVLNRRSYVAANMAREGVDNLKGISFYRLPVSTQPIQVPELATVFPGLQHDYFQYPIGGLEVSGVNFKRYTVVDRVRKKPGFDELEALPWNAAETGLKRITETVVWNAGGQWKRTQWTALTERPSLSENLQFTGRVVSTDAIPIPISSAVVVVADRPEWHAKTKADGTFTLYVKGGRYSIEVSSYPYFTTRTPEQDIFRDLSPVALGDIAIPRKSLGTVVGTVWVADHLVISRVAASVPQGGNDQEWVEVFNPSTYPKLMDGVFGLKFQLRSDPAPLPIRINYLNPEIPAGGFYLFANRNQVTVPPGGPINADAVWDNALPGGPCLPPPANSNAACFPTYFTNAAPNIFPAITDAPADGVGGVSLYKIGSVVAVDTFGWTGSSVAGPEPDLREGNAAYTGASVNGFDRDDQFERLSSTSGASATLGPVYDTSDNRRDAAYVSATDPRNSSSPPQRMVAGTPYPFAYVTTWDSLSHGAVLSNMVPAIRPYAQFILPEVATDSLTVGGVWGDGWFGSSTCTLSNSGQVVSTSVVLNKFWSAAYVEVQLTDLNSGLPLSHFPYQVYPEFGQTFFGSGITTKVDGSARTAIGAGWPYVILVNPGGKDPDYMEIRRPLTLGTGAFQMVPVAVPRLCRLRGRVRLPNGEGLPDTEILVEDSVSSVEVARAASLTGGHFEVMVPTGTFTVRPLIESDEASTPPSVGVIALSGGTVAIATFTVTSDFGWVEGRVKHLSGQFIDTALVLTNQPIVDPTNPPSIDAAFRGGPQTYAMTFANPDGTYHVRARSGVNYRLYAWRTNLNGSSVNQVLGPLNIVAGATTPQDILWP